MLNDPRDRRGRHRDAGLEPLRPGDAALQAGKHVFVEKPIAPTTEQAQRMVDEAERRGLVLAVDHTFVHTGAVRKMRELIDDGLGDIYYYDSVRVNLGLFQHDVSVLWDLAVHDLSIMDYLLPAQPVAVSATGVSHVEGEPENIAYLNLQFENNLIAHIHVNWLAPVKVRRTLVGGSKRMLVYDDLEPSEKVKVYDKGITLNGNPQKNGEKIYQMRVGYRTGDMWAPKLDMAEALAVELKEFVTCIEQKRTPIADGKAGLRVVRILEAATESLRHHGRVIELEPVARCRGAAQGHGGRRALMSWAPVGSRSMTDERRGRIVPAVHSRKPVQPDPAHEVGLAEWLRATYGAATLVEAYARFAIGRRSARSADAPVLLAGRGPALRPRTAGRHRRRLQAPRDLRDRRQGLHRRPGLHPGALRRHHGHRQPRLDRAAGLLRRARSRARGLRRLGPGRQGARLGAHRRAGRRADRPDRSRDQAGADRRLGRHRHQRDDPARRHRRPRRHRRRRRCGDDTTCRRSPSSPACRPAS